MIKKKMINKVNILESVFSVQGKIFFNDGRRRIDLKKQIRDMFEPLETEECKMKYLMEFCLSKKKLLERIEELGKKEVLPVLFYFIKENKGEANNGEQMS